MSSGIIFSQIRLHSVFLDWSSLPEKNREAKFEGRKVFGWLVRQGGQRQRLKAEKFLLVGSSRRSAGFGFGKKLKKVMIVKL
ncbi:hypothetical protein Bhyg_12523 [Pseudolycoriella hygida]|uniref:Uncharacterized protein n=1 Tax=Pseudolycoriella hygida TaxID=35572 RepID=A0A9Q0MXD5_9DIPT|nr:hypothetical protein Bhyg_12523 [Pseudolycoriella hygida]